MQPDLFRPNGVPHEEKLINLAVLLDDDATSSRTIIDLPTNNDTWQWQWQWLDNDKYQEPTDPSLKVKQLCIVDWQNCGVKYEWYVAYVKKAIPGGFEVDHWHRINKDVNDKRKYPSNEDIQNIEKEKIVQCTIEGASDITPESWKRYFRLNNVK